MMYPFFFPFALHSGSCEEVSSLALLLHSGKSLFIRSDHFTLGFLDILTTRGSSTVLFITHITGENCLFGQYFIECSIIIIITSKTAAIAHEEGTNSHEAMYIMF